MDFKQLTYFAATVQEGNISKAAQKLHISQPPLSTKLKELEEELGVTLFERGSRKIELTEAGRLFYNRTTSILELLDTTQKELQDYRLGKLGTLRIGTVSSITTTLTATWLKAFHLQYPDIPFNIFEGNTYEQLERLRNNLIELAIVRKPFLAEDLECTIIKKESLCAIGLPQYFASIDANEISLEKLHKKPLILYRRWEKIIRELFAEHNLTPHIVCLNDDARTTANLAGCGLGIGILPASASSLLPHTPHMVKKSLTDPSLSSDICLLRNPKSYHAAAAQLFCDFLLQQHTTINPTA